MRAADLLARVPLFEGLQQEDLERLASRTREEAFEPGQDIVEAGDPGRTLYVVLEGKVQVLYPALTHDFELARLGPGDFFGEMAVLNDKPRSATVRAVDACRVLCLSQDDFHQTLADAPVVAVQILEELSSRLRSTDEQISGLNDQAMQDGLTGVLNRRAFQDRILEECERTRRYGEAFSLVLVDLDMFNGINENFGHEVGDEILKWLGRLLDEHTRRPDTIFRVGGEEFSILCPRTGEDVAPTVAGRLVGLVADARPPLPMEVKVTVSAGFASCPRDGVTPNQLFQAADRALLRAKADGRNRVGTPPEAVPGTT